jgi:hypothetical protein
MPRSPERQRHHHRLSLLVGEDRLPVTVGEPASIRTARQRLLDLLSAVELGEIDRVCHLAPHTLRAGRSGGDQPPLGALAERKKRALLQAARPGLAVKRAGRLGRIVLVTPETRYHRRDRRSTSPGSAAETAQPGVVPRSSTGPDSSGWVGQYETGSPTGHRA